jgi:hypothetical protein
MYHRISNLPSLFGFIELLLASVALSGVTTNVSAQQLGGHHPPPPKWSIKTIVAVAAKTDKSPDRRKLGLSEEVKLGIDPPTTPGASGATWRITHGAGALSGNIGAIVSYDAQPTAGGVEIEANIGNVSISVSFTVVAPSSVKGLRFLHEPGSPVRLSQKMLVDVHIQFEIQPTDLSFYNVAFREQVGTKWEKPSWGIHPWFAPPHVPAGAFRVPADNTGWDHCSAGGGRSPSDSWPTGGYTWVIPWDYRADRND